MRFIIFVFTAFLSSFAFAKGLSASRQAEENFEHAQLRHSFHLQFSANSAQTPPDLFVRGRPVDVKVYLQQLDTSVVPELASLETVENEFRYIRDTRFLTMDPKFPRRLTWLYPDDGCYARAELAKVQLINHKQVSPKKIFVFGNLSASTKNTFNGRVYWWYHVAVAYRVGPTVFVFDPSIEAQRPLTLEEWNLAVGGNQTSVKYAICDGDTFDPNSECTNPFPNSIDRSLSEQGDFLSPEWKRLETLGRDAQKELGEFPPWAN